MATKDTQVAIKQTYDLDKPAQVVQMATVLKKHIIQHQLYTTIAGKNYAHVEGWQFAGGIMGLFPRVKAVENLSVTGEYKWRAEVEIVERKTGNVVSSGFALCSNKEGKKKTFDEYAVLSMAQTRAIGKAFRNLLGWVMKLAGYEGTPSEEMVKMGDEAPATAPEAKEKPVAKPTVKKGQVIGPDGDPTYVCSETDEPISEAEHAYSVKMFGRPLSRAAQKTAKPKKV